VPGITNPSSMAKILFTAVVADMRNKLNGTVFSKNRYGAFARTKVTPVNPATSYQTNARQNFGAWSQGWRGLTDAQRQSWIDGAPNFPVTDIFGNQKILTGLNLYVQLNTNLQNAGQSAITTCPSPVAIPGVQITAIDADVSDTSIDVTTDTASVPAGFTLFVYATPLITPGRNFTKGRERFVGTTTLTTSAADIYTLWNPRFGLLVAGQKITVYMVLVSNTTGQQGVASSFTTIVVA